MSCLLNGMAKIGGENMLSLNKIAVHYVEFDSKYEYKARVIR